MLNTFGILALIVCGGFCKDNPWRTYLLFLKNELYPFSLQAEPTCLSPELCGVNRFEGRMTKFYQQLAFTIRTFIAFQTDVQHLQWGEKWWEKQICLFWCETYIHKGLQSIFSVTLSKQLNFWASISSSLKLGWCYLCISQLKLCSAGALSQHAPQPRPLVGRGPASLEGHQAHSCFEGLHIDTTAHYLNHVNKWWEETGIYRDCIISNFYLRSRINKAFLYTMITRI